MELPVNYNDLSWKERAEVRKEYIKLQDGKCCFCGNPIDKGPSEAVSRRKIDKLLFPSTFFDHPVHLHHSHDDGLTIGAVHAKCNAVLWQYYGE